MNDKMMADKLLIGRHEWCALPAFKIPAIKAKIDTGAKTSSIHAFNIKKKYIKDVEYVYFDIHPLQGNNRLTISAKAPVIDERKITSSNGHKELRYVIATTLSMANRSWLIEVTLSNRDPLRYRMLLGRQALNTKVIIDPHLSCHQKKLSSQQLKRIYVVK